MSRIGKTVLYTLSEHDVKEIIERRRMIGAAIAKGNTPSTGQEYPAIIVGDWGGSANLRVILDGLDDHWATSRPEWTEDRHKLVFYIIDRDALVAADGPRLERIRLTTDQAARVKYRPGGGIEGATYQDAPVEVEKEPTHEFTWREIAA